MHFSGYVLVKYLYEKNFKKIKCFMFLYHSEIQYLISAIDILDQFIVPDHRGAFIKILSFGHCCFYRYLDTYLGTYTILGFLFYRVAG